MGKRYLTMLLAVILLLCMLPSQAFAAETADQAIKILGDLDGNETVDDEDVIYLLWHTLMPNDYPVNQNVDYDGNSNVDDEDVIYLLWHTLMPDDYPLKSRLTYEEYIAMTAEEQSAYRKTFESTKAFFDWYNAAKAEYDEKNAGLDIGDGSVDLGDIMGGKQ